MPHDLVGVRHAPTMTQKLRTRKSNDLQMNRLMMDLSDEAQDELSETK